MSCAQTIQSPFPIKATFPFLNKEYYSPVLLRCSPLERCFSASPSPYSRLPRSSTAFSSVSFRRTSSFDTIYSSTVPVVNTSTQTPLNWDERNEVVFVRKLRRSHSFTNADELYKEGYQKYKSQGKFDIHHHIFSNEHNTTAVIPLSLPSANISQVSPLAQHTRSISGAACSEIETCDMPFFKDSFQATESFTLPEEGRQCPVPPQLRSSSTKSVDTQTPTHITSPFQFNVQFTDLVLEDLAPRMSPKYSKYSSSPNLNMSTAFAHEPPDGCEKVCVLQDNRNAEFVNAPLFCAPDKKNAMNSLDNYLNSVVRKSVAQMCLQFGFTSVNQQPLNVLIDLLQRFFIQVGAQANKIGEQSSRCYALPEDVVLAIYDFGFTLKDLQTFMNNVDSYAFVDDVPELPYHRKAGGSHIIPGIFNFNEEITPSPTIELGEPRHLDKTSVDETPPEVDSPHEAIVENLLDHISEGKLPESISLTFDEKLSAGSTPVTPSRVALIKSHVLNRSQECGDKDTSVSSSKKMRLGGDEAASSLSNSDLHSQLSQVDTEHVVKEKPVIEEKIISGPPIEEAKSIERNPPKVPLIPPAKKLEITEALPKELKQPNLSKTMISEKYCEPLFKPDLVPLVNPLKRKISPKKSKLESAYKHKKPKLDFVKSDVKLKKKHKPPISLEPTPPSESVGKKSKKTKRPLKISIFSLTGNSMNKEPAIPSTPPNDNVASPAPPPPEEPSTPHKSPVQSSPDPTPVVFGESEQTTDTDAESLGQLPPSPERYVTEDDAPSQYSPYQSASHFEDSLPPSPSAPTFDEEPPPSPTQEISSSPPSSLPPSPTQNLSNDSSVFTPLHVKVDLPSSSKEPSPQMDMHSPNKRGRPKKSPVKRKISPSKRCKSIVSSPKHKIKKLSKESSLESPSEIDSKPSIPKLTIRLGADGNNVIKTVKAENPPITDVSVTPPEQTQQTIKPHSKAPSLKPMPPKPPNNHVPGTGKRINHLGSEVWFCPYCQKLDDGSDMVGCDECDDWYHWLCIGITVEPTEDQWFCYYCSEKKKKKKKFK